MDDKTRLRWLREDLGSCLGEISAILRRSSDHLRPPPPVHIDIEVSEPEFEPLLARDAGVREESPSTITWTWPDGAAVSYDWRTRAVHWQPPP